MKKKLLFLLVAFAFTFAFAIRAKAVYTDCTNPLDNSKFDWVQTSQGRFADGAGTQGSEPTCSTSGETYWQTTRTNITGGECSAEGLGEGPCHMDIKWVKQTQATKTDPTFTWSCGTSISFNQGGSRTCNITASTGCASVTWSKTGTISLSATSGNTTTISGGSGTNNSVTATCTGDSTHTDAQLHASVTVNIPTTSDEIASIDPASTTKELGPSDTGEVTFSALNSDGQSITATWSVSGSGMDWITADNCNGQTKKNCDIHFKGKECVKNKSITVTATDTHGTPKTATVTLNSSKYTDWKEVGPADLPDGTIVYTRESAKEVDTCDAYEGSSNNSDGSIHFTMHYNRCCGGGTTEEKKCYEKPGGVREVTYYQVGYTEREDKYCQFACYKISETEYKKTYYEDNYEKVEDRFCDTEPTPHCYKIAEGKYEVTLYKEGYVQVEDRLCEKHCYEKTDKTREVTFYQEGYKELDDKYCVYACYKKPDGKFVKTYYEDNYEKVDDDKCTDVPKTAATVSKIVYALSLFLIMSGSGIIVYQLTKTKKELEQ